MSLAAMTSVYVGSPLGVVGGVGSSNDLLGFVWRNGGAALGLTAGEEYAGGPSDVGVSDGRLSSKDGLEEVSTCSTPDVGQFLREGRLNRDFGGFVGEELPLEKAADLVDEGMRKSSTCDFLPEREFSGDEVSFVDEGKFFDVLPEVLDASFSF